MKRIFSTHAYSEAPRTACYWPSTAKPPDQPTATGTLKADVVVIGGGFTGLNAALRLAEGGADVIVLEAQTIGWGASGRNGGFCCLGGTAASDTSITRNYGAAARAEFCLGERAAVEHVRDLIKRHKIRADTHSDGETLMAHNPRAAASFDKKAHAIERDYGVTPQIIEDHELTQHGLKGPFSRALTNPLGFALNPMKYVQGLARAAQKAGVRIFTQSPVLRIDPGYTVYTEAAQITAPKLIIATNGYSSDDLPRWLKGRYIPTQSNVLVTRKLTEDEITAQGWSSHQMCYDDRFFLHYFRLMPNGQFLFGMRGGLFSSARSDQRMHRNIRSHFETMFPAWAHVETPYSWNGLLSIAPDLTPYAGPIPEMPGAYAALSYHGNGVSMGSYSGALIADQILGREDLLHPAVMQRPPGKFPLGHYRRAQLWPVYAWASLTGA